MKTSKELSQAISHYQSALSQIREIEVTMGNLSHKKSLLGKEIEAIDDRLAAFERERPGLLEQVLAGSRPEKDLTGQQLEGEQLKAARIGKTDLLELIGKQLQAKNSTQVDLNARTGGLRRAVFAAIEQEILGQMPAGCLEYLTRLHTVAGANGGTALSLLEGLLPQLDHNGWQAARDRVLVEYGIQE